MKIQPAVKKETTYIGVGTAIAAAGIILIFALLHGAFPDSVSFDGKVVAGALIGAAVAAGNFFLMAMTVQKVVSTEDQEQARNIMKASYRNRMLLQLLWALLALVLPFINGAAGLIPLFVPSVLIKLKGIFGFISTKDDNQ